MSVKLDTGKSIALAIVGLGILYIASGHITREDQEVESAELKFQLPTVKVSTLVPQEVVRIIEVNGKTAPNREVTLKSEVKTKVLEIVQDKGQLVKKGDLIIKLDQRDWPARLKQAKANRKQQQLNLEATEKMVKGGLRNQGNLAQAQALLAQAEAEVITMENRLAATMVRAPFDGVVESRMVEVGDYVREGDAITHVIDYSPYLVVGEVSEKDAPFIFYGQKASAELVSGDTVEGKIRYVASKAKDSTRSFKIELAVENKQGFMTSGVTARIRIPMEPVLGALVSPAHWSINDSGVLGVKSINNENKVVFNPIEIIKAEATGAWVSGLGENPSLITQGQGFVEIGELVDPIFDTATLKKSETAKKETPKEPIHQASGSSSQTGTP